MNCKYCKADCVHRGENRKKDCRGHIRMTNADRIRSMSDEELAVFLADEIAHGDCYGCDLDCYKIDNGQFVSSCQKAHFDWLKQPVKDGEG